MQSWLLLPFVKWPDLQVEKGWPDYTFIQRFICSFSECLLSLFYVQNTTLSSCCSVDSHLGVFATPWTAAHLASLSFSISRSLLKLMSIESVMPSNHLILCHPLLFLPSSSWGISVNKRTSQCLTLRSLHSMRVCMCVCVCVCVFSRKDKQ